MVNKGKIRGNGRQLASYLLAQSGNERVRILDVDSMTRPTAQDLRNLLHEMSLNELLTRSRQGIYHAIVNPSPHDRELNDVEWLHAAEIMAQELGFDAQRRAVVLHQKQGRTHAHIVMERYQDGKMIPVDHNYRKHDAARARMEAVFGHTATAQKNPRRNAMKDRLSALWQQTDSAAAFVHAVRKEGWQIAKGQQRKPFLVVDAQRSFNLVRHLEGVTTKEVRQRLKGFALPEEKQALALARTADELTKKKAATTERPQPAPTPKARPQEQAAKAEHPRTKQPRTPHNEFMESFAAMQQQRLRKRGPRPH